MLQNVGASGCSPSMCLWHGSRVLGMAISSASIAHLPSHCAAGAGGLAEARAEPRGSVARSGDGATPVKHIASASASPAGIS